MSPRFVLGRENVPCVVEVVNRSLKADCTDFTQVLNLSPHILPTPDTSIKHTHTQCVSYFMFHTQFLKTQEFMCTISPYCVIYEPRNPLIFL